VTLHGSLAIIKAIIILYDELQHDFHKIWTIGSIKTGLENLKLNAISLETLGKDPQRLLHYFH